MAEKIKITVPFILRDPDREKRILVSEMDVALKVVPGGEAPLVAELVQTRDQFDRDRDVRKPFRVREGRYYGRWGDNEGRYSRDTIEEVADVYRLRAADVVRQGVAPTHFNYGHFQYHAHDRGGMYGDELVFVEDYESHPGLRAAAAGVLAKAAKAVVVDGVMYGPCSGPVLSITHRSSGRQSDVELRYAHSIGNLQIYQVMFDALDPAATFERIGRRYGGRTRIDGGIRLEIDGEMPPIEIPIDRMAEAAAASLIYDFRNDPMHLLKAETVRAIVDLRRAVQARWPDHPIPTRPFSFLTAFDHFRDTDVPDATDLLPHLERFLGLDDLGYIASQKAKLGTVIDYLQDRLDYDAEMDEIADALSFG